MSTPLASYTDLETYLGMTSGTINAAQATLMLEGAQSLCEGIISPLPASAKIIVLGIAARGYNNVTSATQTSVGSASVSYGVTSPGMGVGGIYLSRQDKANLRRLNGAGGAFSIDTLPPGVSAVQSVTIGGSPTGGTFTLSFVSQTTAGLAFNASAAAVQAALEALTAIGSGNIVVSGVDGGPFTVTFAGDLATTPVPILGADGSGLTGGTSPTVVVAVVTAGVKKPGQGLPPWGFDYYDSGTPSQYVPGGFL